jgi:L-seryl-tRNA(Ser) seleniumtransferase
MDPRRAIPAVEGLLAGPAFASLLRELPRERVIAATRAVQHRVRQMVSAGTAPPAGIAEPEWYAAAVRAELAEWLRPSLVPVLNATGVVLHTNLGRAPLAPAALDALAATAGGYSNLEYDLETGGRGSRYDHCVAQLRRLTGAEDALVVNNNAAALVLALNTLALGREAIISRGELVEIGGEFRVAEIMARSGARMVEVGATNRTHLRDFQAALSERTALFLKVHRSNFRVTGFVAEVAPDELAQLAHEHGRPLLHDLGSGLLLSAETLGLPAEPTIAEALAQGADLVTASGDKLLGGPQAGILCGRSDLVAACRTNPLCRAFRVDKLTVAALSATLALYFDPAAARQAVPALRMLTLPGDVIDARARAAADALGARGIPAETVPATSQVGGGALPEAGLPSTALALRHPRGAATLERALRTGAPPVIARIQDERVLLDLRTVPDALDAALVDAVAAAWNA